MLRCTTHFPGWLLRDLRVWSLDEEEPPKSAPRCFAFLATADVAGFGSGVRKVLPGSQSIYRHLVEHMLPRQAAAKAVAVLVIVSP